MIFLGPKFWLKVISFLGSMKDVGIFLGREKKKPERDFFGLRKKDKGIFLGMLKKEVIFLGVVIFSGIKYEPLSDLPVIKICEGPLLSLLIHRSHGDSSTHLKTS